MELELRINGVIKSLDVAPNDSLRTVLHQAGYFSVKHGCETGECGACTVLVDGLPRPSCVMLAAQVGGCTLTTVESLGNAHKLHPVQEAFIDTGAVQCGFCSPGMLLSAYALLNENPSPTEEEVRDALSGNLCRCSGYVKPVEAVMRAAAMLRGEAVVPISRPVSNENAHAREQGRTAPYGKASSSAELSIMGKAERKINAVKLVTGKPAFVDDIELRDMLYARVLTSPHAHAIIRSIDASEARAMSGVHAILTYRDIPRVPYTSAGRTSLEPGPHDQYCLDYRVRFVGDRVAVVAAESPEIAEEALRLIKVDYEILPAILDPRQATDPGAPDIHPEPESNHIYDASRNIVARMHAEIGNVEHGFAEADLVVDGDFIVNQVQQAPIENHVVITHWDEDERLVVRTGTEMPYQVRSIIAPLIGLPPRRIRIIKSHTGGSFGVKREVLLEDLCALLTISTNRPVKIEFSRAEEFRSSRSRHPQIIRMKTGVKNDGTIVANSMVVLANTGAYGTYALDVQRATGAQTLGLYPCENTRFVAEAVYTNLPPSGAFSGLGAPQGFFALESHMDEIAKQLNMDALELRRKNWIKMGDANSLAIALSEGKKDHPQIIDHCELPECLQLVTEKLQWSEKRGKRGTGRLRRGVGIALAMHTSNTNAGIDVGGASIKLNEDGTFNVHVGSPDTNSDTLLAQIVAEALGVQLEDILIHAADTDITPFYTGNGTSSLWNSSIGALTKAAEQVRIQILEIAAQLLNINPASLTLKNRLITASNGQKVSILQVAHHAFNSEHLRPIMATASSNGQYTSPSFAAQGAEVEVDTETGVVSVLKAISVVDAGRIINPVIAEGQIEGSTTLALGYSISEEMIYDQHGALLTTNLGDYRIYNALDMPEMETYILDANDTTNILSAKDCSEIAVDAMAPAIANAVADALDIRIGQLPLTPERILRAIHAQYTKR